MKVNGSNVLMLQNHFFCNINDSFVIEIFYIQTVPGTKHHRFILGLTFFAKSSFFRHKKRLMRIEHLQSRRIISSEPYFKGKSQRCNAHCSLLLPWYCSSSSYRKCCEIQLCIFCHLSYDLLVVPLVFQKIVLGLELWIYQSHAVYWIMCALHLD